MTVSIDKMSLDANLSPVEFIDLMFERTDEDGILYIPGWHYDIPGNSDEENSYRCRVNWNISDCEKISKEFTAVFESIKRIADVYDEIDGDTKVAEKVLSKDLLGVWNTFIRPFDIGEIDVQQVSDICDKLNTMEWVKELSLDFGGGKKLSDGEKSALKEYMDISVSKDELSLLDKYRDRVYKDSEKRVGSGICAYDVIIHAMRTCRLINIGAPKFIVNNEGRTFAAAMVLHKYGISKETVDNSIRMNIERLELMTDAELDEYFRPKKSNSRKSMAPLFVYLILKEHSNSKKHLRQRDILEILEKYPYEISIERKSLSRIIHNIIDSQLSVYSDQTGTWLEQE